MDVPLSIQFQQAAAAYINTCTQETSYVCVPVYQSISMREVLGYVSPGHECMAFDWLKIRQKQMKVTLDKVDKYLAFSSQKQVRCEAGQSQGSCWRVICTWF